VKRKIKFWAEIVNTAKFPTLIQEVKKGWGVSIGGMAHGARWVFKKFGKVRKLVLDIRDMVVNHVQLIPPTTVRGQKEAKVESVAIQETMLFAFVTKINITVKDGSGVKVLDVS
jgi:hypothetical protein